VIKIERSIFIDRPVSEVFDFMTDLSTSPQWDRDVTSAEWISEGPVRPGSTYGVVTGFLGRKIELVAEITAWDPAQPAGCQGAQRATPDGEHDDGGGTGERDAGDGDQSD
jgi:uncharacterized membrane protein